MIIMEGRLVRLRNTLAGLEKTGIPLVGFDGQKFLSGEKGDDPALYYIVPKLMSALHLSPESAVNLFFTTLLTVPFLLGLVGFFLLVRDWRARLAALPTYLFLFVTSLASWDVYIALSAAIVSMIPLFLYLYQRRIGSRLFYAMGFLAGFSSSFLNTVRMHSGTPVVIFIFFYLWLDRVESFRKRLIFFAFLCAGWMIPQLVVHQVMQRRDAFLQQQDPQAVYSGKHVVWTPIYTGLAYLANPYGLPTSDKEVKEEIQRESPTTIFTSSEFDQRVKSKALSVIRSHPYFFVRSLFAKAGVFLMYAVAFGNIGLFWALKKIRDVQLNVSFLAATAFSTLAGFAVTPYHFYCLGFIALVALYGTLGLAAVLDHDNPVAKWG